MHISSQKKWYLDLHSTRGSNYRFITILLVGFHLQWHQVENCSATPRASLHVEGNGSCFCWHPWPFWKGQWLLRFPLPSGTIAIKCNKFVTQNWKQRVENVVLSSISSRERTDCLLVIFGYVLYISILSTLFSVLILIWKFSQRVMVARSLCNEDFLTLKLPTSGGVAVACETFQAHGYIS